MALILLQVLLLGVIAAAVDDVPVTWSASPRSALLPCEIVEWPRVQPRRPPPPLDDERSRPKPYIWKRGRDEISSKRVSSNGTLEVARKGGDGEGVYQCGVRHHGGIVLGYPVNLKFPFLDKQFSSQPEDVEARLGQPLIIPCRVSSGPPAAITWLKNGESLVEHNRYYILQNELLITDVRIEDAGTYRCIATNSLINKSKSSREGRVTVLESTETDVVMLPIHHEEYSRPRWGSLVLPCPVLGWPRPKLIWELTPPLAGSRTSELESSEEVLRLQNLDSDQIGLYACSVEGRSDIVKTFNVSYTEPVEISHPPLSKEVMRASTVRFNCTARGSPEPTISWYKDGEPLALAGRINLRTSADRKRIELVISGVTSDDAGVYQCFASNGVSIASQWAELSVTGPGAAAPGSVQCAPAGPAAVALRWRPAANRVIAYTVDSALRDKPSFVMTGQPHMNTEETVRVREPLTPYQFQVRAYIPLASNKNVASDMSQSVVCQGQGVPIKLLKLEDDQVLVSWHRFAKDNPGVVQWVVQTAADAARPSAVTNVTLDGDVHNYTLNVAKSPLFVRVLGSRTLDWLPQNLSLVPWSSTELAGQDLDDGEVIPVPYELDVEEVTENSFSVTWQCEGAARYTYLVCVRKLDGNDDCQESLKTSAVIENLQSESEYEVRVQARVPGRALGGAFTEPYHVMTGSRGPQRFKDLTYKFVNASAVRVSWSGDAANYTVRHSARLKLPVELWAAVRAAGNSVLINGIEPTEQTFVMVSGYSPVVHSPILTVPPQLTDSQSKELQYTYTRGGVRVTWRGAGRRLVRYAQNITQPLDTWRALNVTDTTVELTDLDPELPVFVMVSVAGADARSQVLNVPARPAAGVGQQIGIGLGVGFCILCVFVAIAFCVWRKKKMARNRTPHRSRRAQDTRSTDVEQEGSEMRAVGGAGAVGGASGAGHARLNGLEPLLNGHVHIIDNPTSKTPNGKLKKGRRQNAFDAFDVSRYEPDTTVETSLDSYGLLDTSRRPELDLSRSSRDLSTNNSFHKLPDDNMNSELTRSSQFQLDNSKIQPTLQPNG